MERIVCMENKKIFVIKIGQTNLTKYKFLLFVVVVVVNSVLCVVI